MTVLAGRTDVMADGGGPQQAWQPAKVAEFIKEAAKLPTGAAKGVTRKAGPWEVGQPYVTLQILVTLR